MRYNKIITLIVIFTVFAFLHVFFQTEILKLGYTVKEKEDVFQHVTDTNRTLRFNNYVLESPYNLERYVSVDSQLSIAKPHQIINVVYGRPKQQGSSQDQQMRFRFPVLVQLRNIFSGRTAEAETIQ